MENQPTASHLATELRQEVKAVADKILVMVESRYMMMEVYRLKPRKTKCTKNLCMSYTKKPASAGFLVSF